MVTVMNEKKRYIQLATGEVFEGLAFGADIDRSTIGELVFTTGMGGYLETLTDESYWGQIVLQTFPLIGNYGVIEEDFEGLCTVRGYVVRDWCRTPSNFRCQYDLDTFLKKHGIPGVYGIDTRALTKRIREQGVVNARLTDTPPADVDDALRTFAVRGAVAKVSTNEKQVYAPQGTPRFRVALLDYGAKYNIIRALKSRGCEVTVLPANASAEEVLALNPDGVMLSNGPGDPAENTVCIETIRQLIGKVPMFGICLGHQLLALANGGTTVKLKYGHRGVNQPVRDVESGRTYITSQNHGYAVVSDSLPTGRVRFVNANDNTCEGVDYPDARAFSVQFHPEACSGPHDTAFLFDRFMSLMEVTD